ncbi:hypothetical protein [Promicromonospora sukumoe]
MSDYTVRVWDRDFNLIDSVTHGWRADDPETICVPADSEIGQALLDKSGPNAYLTVDRPGQPRWCGRTQQVHFSRPFGRGMLTTARFMDDAPMFAMLEGIAELVKRGAVQAE